MLRVSCSTLDNRSVIWTNQLYYLAVVGSILCSMVLFFNSWGATQSVMQTLSLFLEFDLIMSSYHIGFPVFARISAGFYGSLFFVFVRCVSVLSKTMVYVGVNSLLDSCNPLHGHAELLCKFSARSIPTKHIWS